MASVWKHPNSKFWSACFRLPDGRRTKRTTKFTDRKKAQTMAEELETLATNMVTVTNARKVISTIYQMKTGKTLSHFTARSYLEKWIVAKRPEIDPDTAEKYEATSLEFLTFLKEKADQDLYLVTLEDLHDFRNHIAQQSSPKTANNKLVIVAQAFRTAWKDGHLTEDIGGRVAKIKIKGQQQKRDPFTTEQVRSILSQATGEWVGMVLFGYYTGQRLGDICSLRWKDLELNIDQETLAIVSKKQNRTTRVPLAPPLLRWINNNKKGKSADAPLFPASDALVQNNAGKVSALSKQFLLVLAACGLAKRREAKPKGIGRNARREISPLSFHSFRHTLTTELKKLGGGAAITQDIVGHDSSAVSRNYTHVNDADKRRYIQLLPDITQIAKPAKSRKKL